MNLLRLITKSDRYVSVIAWALLHDVGLAEFDEDLNTVGLVTNNGQRKIGYQAFKASKETLSEP